MEAQPPLIVDPNAILPSSVAMQRFQSVSRRSGQVAHFRRTI